MVTPSSCLSNCRHAAAQPCNPTMDIIVTTERGDKEKLRRDGKWGLGPIRVWAARAVLKLIFCSLYKRVNIMALNIQIVLCFLAVYINVEMAFYFTIIRDTFIPSNLIYFIVDILYSILYMLSEALRMLKSIIKRLTIEKTT